MSMSMTNEQEALSDIITSAAELARAAVSAMPVGCEQLAGYIRDMQGHVNDVNASLASLRVSVDVARRAKKNRLGRE